MTKNSTKKYLLITFENLNQIEQEILEIALEYEIIPYSSKQTDSLIFECTKITGNRFIERLKSEDIKVTYSFLG